MKTLTMTANKFQDVHGNTYHVTKVNVDEKILLSGITYGYDDQYIQTGIELLIKAKYLSKGFNDTIWRWCSDRGIDFKLYSSYGLKRDLYNF